MEDNFFMDWDEGNGFRMIQVKCIKFTMHFISIFIMSSPHSLSEIDFPHSNISVSHKTVKSGKKTISLLVLFSLFVRKENLFQKLLPPMTALQSHQLEPDHVTSHGWFYPTEKRN